MCSLQGVPNSEDYEFLKSQLQLWSKICKVSTYIRTCTARVCYGSLPTVVCACWRLHCKCIVCELVWLALATMTLNDCEVIVCFQGNNARTIAALDKGNLNCMTFKKALHCTRDKDLDPSLRSKFVELIKGQYTARLENHLLMKVLYLHLG